jgi:hypothetical protein
MVETFLASKDEVKPSQQKNRRARPKVFIEWVMLSFNKLEWEKEKEILHVPPPPF